MGNGGGQLPIDPRRVAKIASGAVHVVTLDNGGTLQEEDVARMRRDIVRTLNMFEQVVLTAHDSVGDEDRIRALFNGAMRKNYEVLRDFVKEWTKNDKRSGWSLLEQVLQEWNPPQRLDQERRPL